VDIPKEKDSGWNKEREDLRSYQEQKNHEFDKEDDVPHCRGERCSQGYIRKKRRGGWIDSPKNRRRCKPEQPWGRTFLASAERHDERHGWSCSKSQREVT
jgi:hypothetical protein